MNIIFLDFDGVVNIPYWEQDENGKYHCNYNFPHDGTVNNYQAIQWVSEFCEKYNYNIVVSSSWRTGDFDYKKCLYDSGLRKNVKIIGATPRIATEKRGDEITQYLKDNPQVGNYLIFDDDTDMTIHMEKLIKCDPVIGFTLREYTAAEELHNRLENEKIANLYKNNFSDYNIENNIVSDKK